MTEKRRIIHNQKLIQAILTAAYIVPGVVLGVYFWLVLQWGWTISVTIAVLEAFTVYYAYVKIKYRDRDVSPEKERPSQF